MLATTNITTTAAISWSTSISIRNTACLVEYNDMETDMNMDMNMDMDVNNITTTIVHYSIIIHSSLPTTTTHTMSIRENKYIIIIFILWVGLDWIGLD